MLVLHVFTSQIHKRLAVKVVLFSLYDVFSFVLLSRLRLGEGRLASLTCACRLSSPLLVVVFKFAGVRILRLTRGAMVHGRSLASVPVNEVGQHCCEVVGERDFIVTVSVQASEYGAHICVTDEDRF